MESARFSTDGVVNAFLMDVEISGLIELNNFFAAKAAINSCLFIIRYAEKAANCVPIEKTSAC